MDFVLPHVGEGLHEVELIRWLVGPGHTVNRGQSLVEVMSDKATMEVTATFAGIVQETLAAPGARVKVGQVVLRYSGAEDEAEQGKEHNALTTTSVHVGHTVPTYSQTSHDPAVAAPPASVGVSARAHLPAAAPSVRHLARHLGIDLAAVRGTGPAGRILLEDIASRIKTAAATAQKSEPGDKLQLDLGRAGTKQQLLGLRRKIAERMAHSSRSIPHYSYIDECDVCDLVRLRNQLKEPFAEKGIRLTYLPFIVKAASRALREVPIVNSTYDEAAEEVTLHDHYHIGIAVAVPGGLIVPVVNDADKKDIATIAREIERLSSDARAGKSKIDDLRGGTFTITSVGNIGGLISTPIINAPEVGIMGVGRVVKRPVYDASGELRPADMLYLSFSFDHRILDGAIGATFGNAIIRHLQRPATLLLDERP